MGREGVEVEVQISWGGPNSSETARYFLKPIMQGGSWLCQMCLFPFISQYLYSMTILKFIFNFRLEESPFRWNEIAHLCSAKYFFSNLYYTVYILIFRAHLEMKLACVHMCACACACVSARTTKKFF